MNERYYLTYKNVKRVSVKPEKREVFEIFQKYFMKYFRAKNFMKFYITTCRVYEKVSFSSNVTHQMKSSSQCLKSAATARKVIGMVRMTFRNLDVSDFRLIYKTYIRPHLEFCIQAWSPHFVKDIQVLENVEKAATNLVPKLRKYSYPDRLKTIGITSLKERRVRRDMIEVYKLLTGK